MKGLGIGGGEGADRTTKNTNKITPDIQVILKDAHNTHGQNFKLTMPGWGNVAGNRVMNFITNMEDVDYILTQKHKFPDRGWLLDGLKHRLPFSLNAMPNNDKYVQHRTAIAQAFSRQNLDGYFDATIFECNVLGKNLVSITDTDNNEPVEVDITSIVLEHVMCNFGTSVIGRTYTASNVKRLESDSWQLQLGSLFDLIVPRWIRVGSSQKDFKAQDNAREIIDATIKSLKIDTKRALRDAFITQLGGGVTDHKALSIDDINGFGGLTKEQYFKAANMELFRPKMKDTIWKYITRARRTKGGVIIGDDEVKANLNMFMEHLEKFIYDRIPLYYDIIKYDNGGVFDLENFILLLAPDTLEVLQEEERRELVNKIRAEIDSERPAILRDKPKRRAIDKEFNGSKVDAIEKYLLRANLRKEDSTLGNIFSENSRLGKVGKSVQRIFGTSGRSLLQNIVTTPSDRGLILPQNEVYDAITNSLLAGYFSTAMTTTWIVWKLSMYPEYQERIYNELLEFGGFRQLAAVSLSKDMKTSRAFIYECLRTFPTVPVHARRSSDTTQLPSGYELSSNELVLINNFNIFNDETIWGESGKVFNPERWLEGDYLDKNGVPNGPPESLTTTKCPMTNTAKTISKFAFAPFGYGHRACPAPEFALSVIQLTLLKFVEETIMEATNRDVIPSIGFALGNIGGCYVKLTSRN